MKRIAVAVLLLALLSLAGWLISRSVLSDRTEVSEDAGAGGEGAGAPSLVGINPAKTAAEGSEEPFADARPRRPWPLTPSRTYEIRGVVVLEDGRPVNGVRVIARGPDGHSTEREAWAGDEGRFLFGGLPRGRFRVRAEHGWVTHRASDVEVRAGAEVTIVLEPNPYVDLYFVAAQTGRGLRINQMEICDEIDGKEVLRRIPRETRVKKSNRDPWRFRFYNPHPERRLRMQVRTLGYEPSPWIDAPVRTESEPVYVKVRPDPEGVSRLVIDARTDSGEEIGWISINVHKEGWKLTDYDTVLENGRATLDLLPGRYRFLLGLEAASFPTRPVDWYMPFSIDVEIGRGQTVTRSPLMVKGGFVRLRACDAITDVFFERDGEKLVLQPSDREDEKGEYTAAGPVPPGRWKYGYVDSEQRDCTGDVTVIAGRFVDSTATPAVDSAEEDR